MATILVANELGTGYYHIRTMLPIVKALRARGHKCILSVPKFDGLEYMLKGLSAPIVRSPTLNTGYNTSLTGRSAASFSDIIAHHGFRNSDWLGLLVSVWETMIKEMNVDLVIAEHGPTLCLAAMGLVPVINVGDDFSIPPAEKDVFPPYNDQEPMYPIEALVENVARVQRARGGRVPQTLTEVFRTAGRFVCAFPELDMFRTIRTDPVIGPMDTPVSPMPLPPEPRIFLYLHRLSERTRMVLGMAVATKIPAEAHIFDARPEAYSRLESTGIKFHPEPQPIEDMLARSSLVIHHGGNGVMNNATAAGRSQVLAIDHIGNLARARVLERLGVGQRIAKVAKDPKIEEGIEVIKTGATSRSLGERAQALAARIAEAGPYRPIDHIVDRCEEALFSPAQFIH